MSRLTESLDDWEARRARQAEEDRRWVAEYRRLFPDLWFVLRHSGRSGTRWRVVFQSRDQKEAEDFYLRKAYPRNRPAITYAATRLCHGIVDPFRAVSRSGDEPLDGSVPHAIDGEIKTAHERDEREARQAKRAKRRIAAPPVERVRIATVVEEAGAVEVAHEEAAVAEAVTAERTA